MVNPSLWTTKWGKRGAFRRMRSAVIIARIALPNPERTTNGMTHWRAVSGESREHGSGGKSEKCPTATRLLPTLQWSSSPRLSLGAYRR